jgi:RNA polymerase sigma-70 factor, ECF subfamily
MDDESRLIRAMAKGDRSAWARMYDRHVRDVFAVVYHVLGGDRGLAEDVNQEVWLLAIEQFDRFDPARGKFRDWILGIGRHRALRRHRRAAGAGADEYFDAPAGSRSPSDHLEEIERADLVRVALLRLTEDHRRVLLDKYVAGSSVAEIASQIGRSAKAVESLLSRARSELRNLLEPYFSTEVGGERHEPNDASRV